ncbi:MAG: FAD-dependent oxidoreductase [Anaerolineae bacterium]|nr:FAD-dependent oxidoreductase [Anaerolineae bacterium]
MQKTRIVVLGGGYSGVMAAGRLASNLRGKPVEITLVNAAPEFVQRIRFHQLAANQSPYRVAFSQFFKGKGVEFIQARATAIQPDTNTITLNLMNGQAQTISYDYLVYALGSFVDTSRVPGAAEYAMSLGTEATSIQLRDRLPTIAERGGRLVICGGGFTGLEVTTELAESYPNLKITLITSDTFGAKVSQKGRSYLKQVFERLHIKVIDNANIEQITANEVKYAGGALPYDICIWSSGFTVPELARQSGIKVNEIGQIAIDDHLCSISHPNIYAVGDAADASQATGTPTRMACANAIPMGAYAADELTSRMNGETHRPHEVVDFYRCTSLGRNAALLQTYDIDDKPKETIIKGRLAAFAKETICRYTVWGVTHPRWMFYQHRPKSEQAGQASKAAAQTS